MQISLATPHFLVHINNAPQQSGQPQQRIKQMTKNEIKGALDLAGVSYKAKANLETLQALFDQAVSEQLLNDDGTLFQKGPEGDDAVPPANLVPAAKEADLKAKGEAIAAEILSMGEYGLGTNDEDAACPHCGINHKDNGWQRADGYPGATNEHICLACGGQWGPAVPVPGTGLKIEKDRPEQNGVKRPSIGGKCRAIWDALDAYRTETGEIPTSKVVKELAADEGWNPNNASIEFYQWRKFNGISKTPKA